MTPKRMGNRQKPLPPVEELLVAAQEFFEYRDDGILVYRKDPRHQNCHGSKVIGKEVGGDDGHGYLMCVLLGHKFKVHQVVWLLHYGKFPGFPIDHEDRNRRNNRISNLREASDLENLQNISTATNANAGSSKVLGRRGFAARVQVRGRKHYLGYFATQELARAAYVAGKRRLSGKFSPV